MSTPAEPGPIRNVSDTALWVVIYRAILAGPTSDDRVAASHLTDRRTSTPQSAEVVMADPELRNYAQQENDYLLSLLLRADRSQSREDPEGLAERNCGATGRSFGKTDPLHAMALNTFAFVLLYKDKDFDVARGSAMKALEILRDLDGQEEMRLESQCLIALAKTKAGATTTSAIQEAFQLPAGDTSPSANVLTAGRSFSEILMSSVLERKLTRLLLLLALREIAERLLKEIEASGDETAHRSFEGGYMAFLGAYYSGGAEEE